MNFKAFLEKKSTICSQESEPSIFVKDLGEWAWEYYCAKWFKTNQIESLTIEKAMQKMNTQGWFEVRAGFEIALACLGEKEIVNRFLKVKK